MFENNPLNWNQLDLAKKSLFIKNITARKISGDNSINLADLPLMWELYGKEFLNGGNLLSGEETESLDLKLPNNTTSWKALDNIEYYAIPDTSFTRDKTGMGDIEYFSAEHPEGITYPNRYHRDHPMPGKDVLLYNPNNNDAQDIRLDALHIMPKDATYDALNLLYREAAKDGDVAYNAKRRYEEDAHKYGEENIDSYEQYFNNEADGLLRNMLIEGSPEYIESKRYYPNKEELKQWNSHLLPYIYNIQHYLETGERPKNIFEEVTVTAPRKKSLGGNLFYPGPKDSNLLGLGDWLSGTKLWVGQVFSSSDKEKKTKYKSLSGKVFDTLLEAIADNKLFLKLRLLWISNTSFAKTEEDKTYAKEHPEIEEGIKAGKLFGRVRALKLLEEDANVKNYNLDRSKENWFYSQLYNSGGSHFVGPDITYTGAYWYPDKKEEVYKDLFTAGTTSYGGNNTVKQRNLIDLYTKKEPNGIKYLRDGAYVVGDTLYNGPIYEGKIYPVGPDSTYTLPISKKAELDSLISADRSYRVNLNNLPQNGGRYPTQIIDNVQNARLKPLKDENGNYLFRASKLWDLDGTLGFLGTTAEKINNALGGSPFVIEQTFPIKWDTDPTHEYNTDWETIKPTITNTQALGGNLLALGTNNIEDPSLEPIILEEALNYWNIIDGKPNVLFQTENRPEVFKY